MAVLVEHEKRRHEILSKSLDLFIEEGYEDVTFQKIADRCGITRTTLYIYFKNKREIFIWSIKQFTSTIEKELLAIITNQSLNAETALRNMMDKIIDECQKNTQLFKVFLTYLIQLQKSGGDPDERVKRRVIRVQHLLSTVIIRGIKNKEFKDQSVKEVNEILYRLIESAIFEIAVLGKTNIEDSKQNIQFAIDAICINK